MANRAAQSLGRLGGLSRSPAKTAAARKSIAKAREVMQRQRAWKREHKQ